MVGLFVACAAKAPAPVVFQIPMRHIDYMEEVKPLLDKRCVVCHSCYNSPCQLKLDSFEGADRGATKRAVYNANVVYMRIRLKNGKDLAISIVINRWHNNVTYLFGERG